MTIERIELYLLISDLYLFVERKVLFSIIYRLEYIDMTSAFPIGATTRKNNKNICGAPTVSDNRILIKKNIGLPCRVFAKKPAV